MKVLNRTVVSWLEKGNFREALIGTGDYFLADPSYTSRHDILLVVHVLLNWAASTQQMEQVGRKLELVLTELSVSSPWKCAEVLLAYTIKAKGEKLELPCDFSKIYHSLSRNLPIISDESEFSRCADITLSDLCKRFRSIGIETKSPLP